MDGAAPTGDGVMDIPIGAVVTVILTATLVLVIRIGAEGIIIVERTKMVGVQSD